MLTISRSRNAQNQSAHRGYGLPARCAGATRSATEADEQIGSRDAANGRYRRLDRSATNAKGDQKNPKPIESRQPK
jgi:hypothetical protein